MARYTPQSWTDGSGGGTPVSAARLGVIEAGIKNADYRAAVRAFHSTTQAITTSTWTALNFNSERFDQENNAASTIHDTVTNNTRLTAKVAGIYLITGTFQFASNATGSYRLGRILQNGATEITKASSDRGVEAWVTCTCLYSMAVNDYVELQAFQDSGGNLNSVNAANNTPEFSMVLVA